MVDILEQLIKDNTSIGTCWLCGGIHMVSPVVEDGKLAEWEFNGSSTYIRYCKQCSEALATDMIKLGEKTNE